MSQVLTYSRTCSPNRGNQTLSLKYLMVLSSPWCPSWTRAMTAALRTLGSTNLVPFISTPLVQVSSLNTDLYSDYCSSPRNLPCCTSSAKLSILVSSAVAFCTSAKVTASGIESSTTLLTHISPSSSSSSMPSSSFSSEVYCLGGGG